jgi:tetratricopeptide (TPR) repeat protein
MSRRPLQALLLIVAMAAVLPLRGEQVSPRDLWPQAVASAVGGDIESAKVKTAQLLETGKGFGIRTFPIYAMSAASLALQTAKTNEALSGWAASTAQQLDPTSPEVAFTLADRAWRQARWTDSLVLDLSGFVRIFDNYRLRSLSGADSMIVVCFAIALSAVIVALSLLFRYGRAAAHDFREILGRRLRGGSVTVLAMALLFAPLFLSLGLVWLILYWFALFFGYATIVERILIIVLLLILAAVPVVLDAEANRVADIDSPVLVAALASAEHSYQPDALRRLQELSSLAGENASLSLLLGNLQLHEGSESQASALYRKSSELADTAGVHVNIGNLHFLNNDFPAAITEYQKAEQLDPSLAIAFYNHAVASGETYKFDEQGQKIEQAKKADRGLVERLLSNPPAQKVIMYHPSLDEAWRLSQAIARKGTARELFGNYSYFDPIASALNPMTIGAILSAIVAIAIWWWRRNSGFAGSCIKCGRTFCHRCKSSRESATYCMQCIHIYLKRDGVSLDTKRAKLDEVHEHQSSLLQRNKLFATFLPGSAQLLEGRTATGAIVLILFSLLVGFAVFVGRLAPVLNPAETARLLIRLVSILLIIVLWASVSLPVYRRKVLG